MDELPKDASKVIKTKSEQHKDDTRILFTIVNSSFTASMIKQIQGVKIINQQTPVLHADHYSGEITNSVGWLSWTHQKYIKTEKLAERIRCMMPEINTTKKMAGIDQRRMPSYDLRKNTVYNQLKHPQFHLLAETKTVKDGKKKLTRVIAIYTL